MCNKTEDMENRSLDNLKLEFFFEIPPPILVPFCTFFIRIVEIKCLAHRFAILIKQRKSGMQMPVVVKH